MPSPFPGMDPSLEGHLWPDVHLHLAAEISRTLNRIIVPDYVARVVTRTVIDELETGESVGVIMPDVQLYESTNAPLLSPPQTTGLTASAPLLLSQPLLFESEIPSIEIRDVAGGTLITSIEILSPTNKRGEGWNEYQSKRIQVLQARAHLLEIDLLRRGRRPIALTNAPSAAYYVLLTRAQQRTRVAVWPISVRASLPIVTVPLREPDSDVSLDLQTVFTTIYTDARYDLSVDYAKPPNPELDISDAAGAEQLLQEKFAR